MVPFPVHERQELPQGGLRQRRGVLCGCRESLPRRAEDPALARHQEHPD